jgi:hypothetical protein
MVWNTENLPRHRLEDNTKMDLRWDKWRSPVRKELYFGIH